MTGPETGRGRCELPPTVLDQIQDRPATYLHIASSPSHLFKFRKDGVLIGQEFLLVVIPGLAVVGVVAREHVRLRVLLLQHKSSVELTRYAHGHLVRIDVLIFIHFIQQGIIQLREYRTRVLRPLCN